LHIKHTADIAQAVSVLKTALEHHPGHVASHMQMGDLQMLLAHQTAMPQDQVETHQKEAVLAFEAAVRLDPSSLLAHQRLGELHILLGDLDSASHHLFEAKNIAPKSFEARYSLGMFHLLHTGDYRYAAKQLVKALDIDSKSALCHVNLGTIYSCYLNQPERARDHFYEAVQLAPEYSIAHFNLAIQYEHDQRYHLAQRHYAIAAQLAPADPAPLFNMANMMRDKLRQPEESRAMYEQVLARDPNHVRACINLAAIHVQLGANDAALTVLDQASSVVATENNKADMAVAFLNLSVLQERHLHDIPAAIRSLRTCVTLNPEEHGARSRLEALDQAGQRGASPLSHVATEAT
jgi:tetratricopeptide (TPR) repeat protein